MVYMIFLAAYLIGSLPFGYILTKVVHKKDIRDYGSGNIGATNVLRVYGPRSAVPVFVLDLLKGLAAVLIARAISDLPAVYLTAGFLAMFGHSFPVYLRFRGGKAVATSIGVLIALSWPVALVVLACFLLIVYTSRYVSLGSIISMALLPVAFWLLGLALPYIYFGLATALLVATRHHENIGRLLKGTESKLGRKS